MARLTGASSRTVRQTNCATAITAAEAAMAAIEERLPAFAEDDVRSQRPQRAGGTGLLTATAPHGVSFVKGDT